MNIRNLNSRERKIIDDFANLCIEYQDDAHDIIYHTLMKIVAVIGPAKVFAGPNAKLDKKGRGDVHIYF